LSANATCYAVEPATFSISKSTAANEPQTHQCVERCHWDNRNAIVRDIIAGVRDPQQLANIRMGVVTKRSEIAKSLEGDYRPEHVASAAAGG